MWILYFLPKKILSHWVGRFMQIRWPGFFGRYTVKKFAELYQINVEEAEKPLGDYASIGEFFIRRLKAGVRPVADSPLVHPADSRIAQIGEIAQGQCVQAKDRFYSVAELIGDDELAKKFQDGLFVTYYLCPTDYHRVHSPLAGNITKARYIPGNLWPVNQWSIENIHRVFAVNERVVLEIQSRVAHCLLVFVGATNVGQIRLSFDPEIVTNVGRHTSEFTQIYQPSIAVEKAQELGLFAMGSTVIMIYPRTIRLQRDDWQIYKDKAVQMGQGFL